MKSKKCKQYPKIQETKIAFDYELGYVEKECLRLSASTLPSINTIFLKSQPQF